MPRTRRVQGVHGGVPQVDHRDPVRAALQVHPGARHIPPPPPPPPRPSCL